VAVALPGSSKVFRVEVSAAPGHADPIGESLQRNAAGLGIMLSSSRATHVYLIQPEPDLPISPAQLDLIRAKLLADPVTEISRVGAAAIAPDSRIVEVHPLPGVMDPVAQSVQHAIGELLGLAGPPQVSTGWRYDLAGPGLTSDQALLLAGRLLANPVIQKIHSAPFHPAEFPHSAPHQGGMGSVKIIGLGDAELTKLSREAHLFLSLDEMRAVQQHSAALGRDPREIELETLAQTWSEHCVHKTLKSRIAYQGTGAAGKAADPIDWSNRPGHTIQPDGTIIIDNLLKRTVAAATFQLIADGLDWTLSVFSDNSGVIAFDEKHAVCIKVETHNHPSAIEPYGGAATGVGGCIRDVIGTGLGARPIANTDVFCVASPDAKDVPTGCLPPRRILTQVVAGVRDYGNRMGIPTVSGGVYFDDRYVGNPLVYCGCIGVMPRTCVKGEVKTGDLIVALGGRTGRDGIHGATFSSAELEHTATDEFSHAVQIGNAITEKQTLDAIMRARDEFGSPLYSGMTDCGAGGFSSAVGEMGKSTGAIVHLDKAPLKYAGLSATEIWISEAQERMVLAVPQANLAKIEHICAEEHVELAVLGTFEPAPGSSAANPDLALMFHGKEVGRLNMHFLHEGIPTPRREATWSPRPSTPPLLHPSTPPLRTALLALLAHPNIASKHWIIRQYDHEVRGSTSIKPLVGPLSRGPGDASVICPVPGSSRGLAISCGLQTGIGDPLLGGDPYLMVLAAIDECVRNLVCVGADPDRIAILDNFCWPSCAKPENLGSLVRAAEGCYDGALAYRTPFVSGKDSLNNQFTTHDGRTIEIPPTLLITGMGIVPDVSKACTMDAKRAGNVLLLVGDTQPAMGGSHYQQLFGLDTNSPDMPRTDLTIGPRIARAVSKLIRNGLVASAHDASDGGTLVAVAEMLIAGSTPNAPLGAALALGDPTIAAAFGESPSRYVLEIPSANIDRVRAALAGIPVQPIGALDESGTLRVGDALPLVQVEDLAAAWLGTLDW
jgi:phosphoribosylformylglycinamidine synthase